MENRVSVGAERIAANANAATAIDIRKRRRVGEGIILSVMFVCAAISVLTTLGIVVVLVDQSLLFFGEGEATIGEFLGTINWQPVAGQFGIWALVSATVTTSFIAMLVALPLGMGAAIYLSEYATPKVRNVLKPILEILAGVPTVVYGFFALQFMTPLLRSIGVPIPGFYNMLSPGIVMGVMIVPMVASLSEDAMSAVPRSLREASYGLGATRLETVTKVIAPAAISGIAAAFILAISRAFGETMIVALAAGAGPMFTFNPLLAAETMTGHIARISSGDIAFGTIDYKSIFAIGLMLFLMTFVLNIISNRIVARFREVYE